MRLLSAERPQASLPEASRGSRGDGAEGVRHVRSPGRIPVVVLAGCS
jgi:hypothetical protein